MRLAASEPAGDLPHRRGRDVHVHDVSILKPASRTIAERRARAL